MILPLNDYQGNSTGENYVWKKCKEYLPENYISFHNYTLNLTESDLIMLVPKLGVLTIEIKGYYAKNIIDAPDNSLIRIKNNPPIPSPYKQALKSRFILINEYLEPNGIDNVYVVGVVCYPYINKQEYAEKGLGKISHEKLTITSEDFETKNSFLEKIEDIFQFAYDNISIPSLEQNGFDDELIAKVGNLISPNYSNIESEEVKASIDSNQIELNKVEVINLSERNYSEFYYHKSSDLISDEKINEIVHHWTQGTKVFFYSDDELVVEKITNQVHDIIKQKNLLNRKAFSFNNGNTFLLNIGSAPKLKHSFNVFNGEMVDLFKEEFDALHKESNFNKDQYIIEHTNLEDIIVKAGAGTGKTYSIVSRINYLIWKKDYDAIDLSKNIAMVTFTNESANDMKKKLSDNFMNYYLLTSSSVFLEYVEYVEDINISTIHAMSKKILQSYASAIGLGKNFSIVTGNFKRRQILQEQLNELIEKNAGFENSVDLSMFHLSERLIDLLEKLDNKNIDIVSDYNKLNFGHSINKDTGKLIEVIYKTQEELDRYCQENNTVSLGDLIRKLKLLYNNFDKYTMPQDEKIDFLFVDEFQDTDDVQIELIAAFKEIFGFKFFVVGDVKQCIYRFRGAEVRAFDTLQRISKDPISIFSLNKNYRTDTKLMTELNTMFEKWDKNGDIEYRGDDVLIGTKNYCLNPEFHKVYYTNDASFEKNFIQSLIKSKESITNKSDKIAILVRYNWQITQIREICEKNKIGIETDIGGELFKIDPTIDLFKLLLALKYNNNAKYLFNLYTTSYVKEDLPKIELLNLDSSKMEEFFYDNLPFRLSKWNTYISRLKEEPVLKVIRDIIDDVKPWETFANKIDAEPHELDRLESYYIRNLDQLFESLILASKTDYLTLNKLSDYLEVMILTRKEEDARASYDVDKSNSQIICTTVHKSKGLEFDTVILPYCEFDISSAKAKGDVDLIYSGNDIGYRVMGNNKKTLFDNDLYKEFQKGEVKDREHEETRILYVALTRAIKKIVYLNKTSEEKQKKNKTWSILIKES